MSNDNTRDDETVGQPAGAETRILQGEGDRLIGRIVDGKYVIEALIGAGGMGQVYRGRNRRTDSPVAIKTLLPDLLVDDTLIRRFEVEAKAASNLRHPNTIRIFDFGREGDILFMVMELLDGISLDGLLTTTAPLKPARVLRIVREVCKSLEEAHAAGLVHRDIKPDNIFLNRVGDTDEEHVKVLDFGVAKLKHKQYGAATLTQAGMIFGTPRYMSPEQARAFDLDGRSDIYALGVIMYEAITGRPPFDADDPVGVLIMHVNEPVPAFAAVNSTLPAMPELEALVMRCLEKDPDRRFDDVRNLLNAIDGVAHLYGLALTDGSSSSIPLATDRTQAFGEAQHTPQPLRDEGFEMLGVSGDTLEPRPESSRYTLGTARSGSRSIVARAVPRTPVGKTAAILGVVLLVAGALLIAIVRGGAPATEPESEVATAPSPASPVEPEPAPAPDTVAVGPVVTVAHFEVRDAVSAAVAAAAARVVTMTITAEPEGALAFAAVEGIDGEPVPLPHTFVFTRDPASPPARVQFNVTAEGYRDATHDAPLAPTGEPIVVALRRRSTSSSRDSGGVWVPPPRDRSQDTGGGFADPYAR